MQYFHPAGDHNQIFTHAHRRPLSEGLLALSQAPAWWARGESNGNKLPLIWSDYIWCHNKSAPNGMR